MITKNDIEKIQEAWGNGLVKIGSLKNDRVACERATEDFLDNLYAFDKGEVLFKPTLASVIQFRFDKIAAKSYFIGGNHDYPEDGGFALNPWIETHFENAGFIFEESRAIAMGNYFLTDLKGEKAKIEYTLGFVKDVSGKLKINLHHSSLPYKFSKK
ncbi:MAG: hypothetical protein MUO34_11070 [Ignavibacteriaceae bacterium]|nr:hypothetical protein [Ignavibacteriaceae bacterium]